MAGRLVSSKLFAAIAAPSTSASFLPRMLSTSSKLLSTEPHGGEGTRYKERERAEEASYIKKIEADRKKAKENQEKASQQVSFHLLSPLFVSPPPTLYSCLFFFFFVLFLIYFSF